MTITTTQKVIKIGTSRGVTIPAKDLRRLGADIGDELEITIRKVVYSKSLREEYNDLKNQYNETLKRLSGR